MFHPSILYQNKIIKSSLKTLQIYIGMCIIKCVESGVYMQSFLIDKYIEINESTYEVTEVFYFNSLLRASNQQLPVKEFHLLSVIKMYSSNGLLTQKDVIDIYPIAANTLSNHLAMLEKRGFINRTSDPADKRSKLLEITQDGENLLKNTGEYYQGLIKFIRSNLSLKQLGNFISALNKINELIDPNHSPFTMINLFSRHNDIQNTFTKLYFFVHKKEVNYIETHDFEYGHADVPIIIALFINTQIRKKTYTEIADCLKVPYQTLMSKVRKLEKSGHMIKIQEKDSHYHIFDQEKFHSIEYFMMFRIVEYYNLVNRFSDKENELIQLLFKNLKEYSIKFLEK
jgi:DNA-binding MarR family transcriptional regulator